MKDPEVISALQETSRQQVLCIRTLTQERDGMRVVLTSEIDARIRAESRALTADGLRVQLAEAQDRLALCAAEVRRRTQAMLRAADDHQAVVARLDAAWTRIVDLRRERDGWRARWRDEVGAMRRERDDNHRLYREEAAKRTTMEGQILALTAERGNTGRVTAPSARATSATTRNTSTAWPR